MHHCWLHQAVLDAYAESKTRPITPEDLREAQESLPKPMIKGNWESASDRCFIGPAFKEVVQADAHWAYKDEVRCTTAYLGLLQDTSHRPLLVTDNLMLLVVSGEQHQTQTWVHL